MWCSASSWTTSWISLGGTSGIWIFLMMSSRPQIAIAVSFPFTPAFATAALMASTTVPESLMVPSAMASGGSGAMPSAPIRYVPPVSVSWSALAALDPMSSPNTCGALRKNAMFKRLSPPWISSIGAGPRGANIFPRTTFGVEGPRRPNGWNPGAGSRRRRETRCGRDASALSPVRHRVEGANARSRHARRVASPHDDLERARGGVERARGSHDDDIVRVTRDVVADADGVGALRDREPRQRRGGEAWQRDPRRGRAGAREEPAPRVVRVGGRDERAVADLEPRLGEPAGARGVTEIPRDPWLQRAGRQESEDGAAQQHEDDQRQDQRDAALVPVRAHGRGARTVASSTRRSPPAAGRYDTATPARLQVTSAGAEIGRAHV